MTLFLFKKNRDKFSPVSICVLFVAAYGVFDNNDAVLLSIFQNAAF